MTTRLLTLTVTLAAAVTAAPTTASVHSAERQIRGCVNTQRAAVGLTPLAPSPALGRAARLHARNMVRWRFFDHDDPLGRGPSERVAMFDPAGVFPGAGENIAAGDRTAAGACKSWMASSGHRANILGDYTHMGAGYALGGPWGRYYVQVFADVG